MKKSHPKSKIKSCHSNSDWFNERSELVLQTENIKGDSGRNLLVEYINESDINETLEERDKIISELEEQLENRNEIIRELDLQISEDAVKQSKIIDRERARVLLQFKDVITKQLEISEIDKVVCIDFDFGEYYFDYHSNQDDIDCFWEQVEDISHTIVD